MQVFYSELPPLPWLGAALVGLLAIVEGLLARSLGRRIARRPGSTPVEPLVAARAAVLAKASSLLGGVWGGGFAGVGLWLAPRASQVAAAKADLPSAALSFVAGAGLVAAALYLEHACRIPEEPTQN
jgi:hypothetical protein